ncbi:MAG: hypothetical protein M1833_006706 [Piccolia ochrophora]|nr:MAG: hypothetical protein M1833_006706 [Piccolia ochrophora]
MQFRPQSTHIRRCFLCWAYLSRFFTGWRISNCDEAEFPVAQAAAAGVVTLGWAGMRTIPGKDTSTAAGVHLFSHFFDANEVDSREGVEMVMEFAITSHDGAGVEIVCTPPAQLSFLTCGPQEYARGWGSEDQMSHVIRLCPAAMTLPMQMLRYGEGPQADENIVRFAASPRHGMRTLATVAMEAFVQAMFGLPTIQRTISGCHRMLEDPNRPVYPGENAPSYAWLGGLAYEANVLRFWRGPEIQDILSMLPQSEAVPELPWPEGVALSFR